MCGSKRKVGLQFPSAGDVQPLEYTTDDKLFTEIDILIKKNH